MRCPNVADVAALCLLLAAASPEAQAAPQPCADVELGGEASGDVRISALTWNGIDEGPWLEHLVSIDSPERSEHSMSNNEGDYIYGVVITVDGCFDHGRFDQLDAPDGGVFGCWGGGCTEVAYDGMEDDFRAGNRVFACNLCTGLQPGEYDFRFSAVDANGTTLDSVDFGFSFTEIPLPELDIEIPRHFVIADGPNDNFWSVISDVPVSGSPNEVYTLTIEGDHPQRFTIGSGDTFWLGYTPHTGDEGKWEFDLVLADDDGNEQRQPVEFRVRHECGGCDHSGPAGALIALAATIRMRRRARADVP